MAANKTEEFKTVRSNFLTDLNSLVTEKADLEMQNAGWRFCRSAYEFARLCRILPNETWMNEEEKTQFNQQFDLGIRTFARTVKGLCSIPRAVNQYTVKLYLSAFEFIRTDLLQFYEKNQTVKPTVELQQAMEVLERQQIALNNRLLDWEYDRDFYNPNEWEKPNLEGIPKQHKWWSKELFFDSDSENEILLLV